MAVNRNGGGPRASALSTQSDVAITSPAEGQVLVYNATTGKWVNGTEGTVNTPTFTSASTVSGGVNSTFTTSAYGMTPADASYTHVNTDWQISTVSNFATTIATSMADAVNKTSWTQNLALGNGTVYIRARHRNEKDVSEWGTQTITVRQVTVFTGSANFSTPSNTNQVTVKALGGGGGGGNGDSGAGGGYISSQVSVTPGTVYAVTVGAGGNAGGNITAGGSSSFGNLVSIGGGQTNRASGTPFAAGSPSQFGNNPNTGQVRGGSGGAGGAGQNAPGAQGTYSGLSGNGGAGVLLPDGTTRGGGAAGFGNSSSQFGSISFGTPGPGAGQNGGVSGNFRGAATAATAGYGAGGGGSSNSATAGTAGIVFVEYFI
jgi:hypothetical protein